MKYTKKENMSGVYVLRYRVNGSRGEFRATSLEEVLRLLPYAFNGYVRRIDMRAERWNKPCLVAVGRHAHVALIHFKPEVV